MSLKAKLEAVIYAAEEPVTLGQLAALFAADALEWKAAQEAAAAEQTAEVAEAAETLPLIEVQGHRDQGTEATRKEGDEGTIEAETPPASVERIVSVGEGEGYDSIVLGDEGREKPSESAEPAAEQAP